MKYRCIVVDDHKLFNDGLTLILKESGKFEVVKQIYNSRNAFHGCSTFMPDIALIDYNMPFLNGLDVVKELKELKKEIKIVIISMYAESTQVKLFQSQGVHGFVSKTTSGTDLVDILLSILNGEYFFEIREIPKGVKSDGFRKKNLLTKREIEVLKLIKQNLTSQQIAEEMNISQFTVETHRKNVNKKLNFGNKQEFFKFLEELE